MPSESNQYDELNTQETLDSACHEAHRSADEVRRARTLASIEGENEAQLKQQLRKTEERAQGVLNHIRAYLAGINEELEAAELRLQDISSTTSSLDLEAAAQRLSYAHLEMDEQRGRLQAELAKATAAKEDLQSALANALAPSLLEERAAAVHMPDVHPETLSAQLEDTASYSHVEETENLLNLELGSFDQGTPIGGARGIGE